VVSLRNRRPQALHSHLDRWCLLHCLCHDESHHHNRKPVRCQGQLLKGQGISIAMQELLFVKRVNNYGMLVEDVYETAHLEILPPRQRSAAQDLSSQDADGLWRITCLNSQRSLLLYNNDQFWNRKLKTAFINSVPFFLERNLTSGTRATTATTGKNKLSRMPSGVKRPSARSTRKLCPANDYLPIEFTSSQHHCTPDTSTNF
jgi:hypothetical protein